MLPELNRIKKTSTEITVFQGLNRTLNTGFSRVSDRNFSVYTEFCDMKNMGSDEFPKLSTRKNRSRITRENDSTIVSNMIVSGGKLIFLDSAGMMNIGAEKVELEGFDSTANSHSITQYGNNVVIFPERLIFHLSDNTVENLDVSIETDNSWAYKLNSSPEIVRKFEDFSIEKIAFFSGKPVPVCAILHGARDLENTDMQAQVPSSNPTQDAGWRNSLRRLWGDIDTGVTVEALGESPSGIYQCYDISESATTVSGLTAENNIRNFVKIDNYYVKITRKNENSDAAFEGIKIGDWVKISGMTHSVAELNNTSLNKLDWGNYIDVLNEQYFKIFYVDSNSIVIRANLDRSVPYNGPMNFERVMPAHDEGKILEVNNRLWTCSSEANEIYSCKQGDATNWQAYGDGIATDSFAVTVGCEGEFTGIAKQSDCAIFFKENHILKMYGTKPSNYTLSSFDAPGVEKGSEKSLVWIGGALYYLSHLGVCRYNVGGQPVVISLPAFGNRKYQNAVAGRHRNKYVISAQNIAGEYEMFVFDTETGTWHKEDDTQMLDCVKYNNQLYYIDGKTKSVVCMDSTDNLLISKEDFECEDEFDWAFETGDLYENSFEKKHISKLYLALSEGDNVRARILLQFEKGGAWIEAQKIKYNRKMLYLIPVTVRRSDFLKIRVEGKGHCVISSIRIDYSGGSSKLWQY